MAKLNESVSNLYYYSFLFFFVTLIKCISRCIIASLKLNLLNGFQIDMEAPDFKDFAKAMTDYIAEYLENIRDRWVFNSDWIVTFRFYLLTTWKQWTRDYSYLISHHLTVAIFIKKDYFVSFIIIKEKFFCRITNWRCN